MLETVGARALLGVVLLGAAGSTTALATATSTSPTPLVQPSKAPKTPARALAAGTIIKLSDKAMTLERVHRDKNGGAVTKDDSTLELNSATAVYRARDRAHKLGIESLKLGERVRARFLTQSGQKVARAVVIMPDRRVGQIVSKDPDGKSFTIHARAGQTLHVTTSSATRFIEGVAKNRKPGNYADLKVGDRVVVRGEEDSQHNFDAALVRSPNADRGAAKTAPAIR